MPAEQLAVCAQQATVSKDNSSATTAVLQNSKLLICIACTTRPHLLTHGKTSVEELFGPITVTLLQQLHY
jgi:hypothetical protein